jgi:hypothetical protein
LGACSAKRRHAGGGRGSYLDCRFAIRGFERPGLSTPGEKEACRNAVAPGDLGDFRARYQRFLNKPHLLVRRPPPPPLDTTKNLNSHRSTLKLALRSHAPVKAAAKQDGAGRTGTTYPVVRYKDAPKTEVYISPTPGKRWGGIGEPRATTTQFAVTNAIFAFAATGKRLRALPIRGQDLNGAA